MSHPVPSRHRHNHNGDEVHDKNPDGRQNSASHNHVAASAIPFSESPAVPRIIDTDTYDEDECGDGSENWPEGTTANPVIPANKTGAGDMADNVPDTADPWTQGGREGGRRVAAASASAQDQAEKVEAGWRDQDDVRQAQNDIDETKQNTSNASERNDTPSAKTEATRTEDGPPSATHAESALSEATAPVNRWGDGWRGDRDRSRYRQGGLVAAESTVLGTPTYRGDRKAEAAPTEHGYAQLDKSKNDGEAEGQAQGQAEGEAQQQEPKDVDEHGGAVEWVTVTQSETDASVTVTSTGEPTSSSTEPMSESTSLTASPTESQASTSTESTTSAPSSTESTSTATLESSAAAPTSESAVSESAVSAIASTESASITEAPIPSSSLEAAPSSSSTTEPLPSPSPSPPPETTSSQPTASVDSTLFNDSILWQSLASSTSSSVVPIPSTSTAEVTPTVNTTVDAQQNTYIAHQSQDDSPTVSSSVSENFPAKTGTAQGANKNEDSSSGPSKGTTAGAVIGGLLGLLVLVTIGICFLEARRRKGDQRQLMRSSWYYSGDVALPDNEPERKGSYLQSRFSAPSIISGAQNRFSHVVANFNPLNLARPSSSRYPDAATPGFVAVPPPQTSLAPAMPPIPSQGGWADRFFAQPNVREETGTPVAAMSHSFPTPMMRSGLHEGQALHVVNRSSTAGSARQLAPFIRVESPSVRSSLTSMSTPAEGALVETADMGRTAAKQAVLQRLAQRPPSSVVEYGASYADASAEISMPLVPGPNMGAVNATPHVSSLFEYDRAAQRQSTDTSSVYSRTTASMHFEPPMTARPPMPQRDSSSVAYTMMRDTMMSTPSMYVSNGRPLEGRVTSVVWQQPRTVGDGIPRAL